MKIVCDTCGGSRGYIDEDPTPKDWCTCPPPAPDPSRCDHPPVAELRSIWCRDCGVYKVDGVVLENEGRASLVSLIKRAEKSPC